MDPKLIEIMKATTPQINPVIGEGVAFHELKRVDEYVDQIFKLISADFPDSLTYVGYRRQTPLESTLHKMKTGTYDFAKSSVYLNEYSFRYISREGTESSIKVPLYLPYCAPGGIMYISGSRHVISPVLTDQVISLGQNSVFVGVIRGKVTFKQVPHTFICNGIAETVKVVWASAYNRSDRQKKDQTTTKAMASLAHYLFCKYGLFETFEKFAKITPVIGGREIDEEHYPSSEWVVCESTRLRPTTCLDRVYQATSLKVAIKKCDFNNMARNLVAGFFYVVDHFPDRMSVDDLSSKANWLVLLGIINVTGNRPHGYLLDEMKKHISSLDGYLDKPIELSLRDIGVNVRSFFELMGVIIENYNDWMLTDPGRAYSMYDKRVTVMQHLLFDVTKAIVYTLYDLQDPRKSATLRDVENVFKKNLKPGRIFKITKNHRELSALSYSGDNKALKFTSALVPQAKLQTGPTGRGHSGGSETQKLHSSVAEVGGYLNIPKAEPSGRSRINPLVHLSEKGVVMRNEDLRAMLDEVQVMISHQRVRSKGDVDEQ